MSDELMNERLIEKAKLIAMIRGYEDEKRRRWDKGIDFIASHGESDDKILLRVITEPRSKSGVIGVDTIRDMSEDLQDYDKAVLIARRFSSAAEKEMGREGIETVSEKFMPHCKLERLYATIQGCIDDLCQAKCGHIPEKESDCKGHSEGHYSCNVRLINDNASFHFIQGWRNLLQNDLKQLLAIGNSVSDQNLEK